MLKDSFDQIVFSGPGRVQSRAVIGWVMVFAAALSAASPTTSHAQLAASVLPGSRSVQVSENATVFATLINAAAENALACAIQPTTVVPASFQYQATDPLTNLPVGIPDTPIDIGAGQSQTFVLSFAPLTPFDPIDVEFSFICANTAPAPVLPGVNTLILSAGEDPAPDVIALSATPTADGVVSVSVPSGANAFSVATVNLGAGAEIRAEANTAGYVPAALFLCRTDPLAGRCITPVAPSVTTLMEQDSTATFSVFVNAAGFPDFEPGRNRITVDFVDETGVLRGRTSVAVATQPATGIIGLIGDSLMAGTHSNHMCENRSIVDCIEARIGLHDSAWSYAGGDKPWSLASLFGYAPDNTLNAAQDGAQWKDAMAQAQALVAIGEGALNTVIIGLGGNDVCAERGHDYTGDLAAIEQDVEEILTFLTGSLPAGGQIGLTGVPDVLVFRDLMVNRDHNHIYESCQAAWDLDNDRVKEGEALDACIDLFGELPCRFASNINGAIEYLTEQLLDYYFEEYGIDEGPCGKVLSSKSSDQDRLEAAQFNLDLNELLAAKAEAFDGQNGVRVLFNSRVYDRSSEIRPFHVSRLDCYHPNRAGQAWLATKIREGWSTAPPPEEPLYFDGFDSQDYCAQEYTTWPACWLDPADQDPLLGDVQISGEKLMVRDDDTLVSRQFDLDGQRGALMQIMFQRDDVSQGEHVYAELSADGGVTWQLLESYDDGDDKGDHRGHFFDLSPFPLSENMHLRFRSSGGLGGDEKVWFDNVKIFAW